MTTDTMPPAITVEEAGKLLGISRRSAYRAAERGEIPTLRVGRRLLVPSATLLTMLGVPQNPVDVETLDDRPRV